MKWEPVLSIDESFRSMQANTLILKSNAKDSVLLEDYKFIHDNNTDARIEFATGIRDIITKDQIRIAEELSDKVTKIMKTLASEVGGF